MPRVIVFDVNETLLDLAALDPLFQRFFGDAAARQQWFAQFIQSALVSLVTNRYTAFGAIGMGALDMLAARCGVDLSDDDKAAIRNGMVHLPVHPDVRESLEKLRAAGLRLATLTNSTAQVAEAQLANAGIQDLFEKAFSADTVQRLKPAPEPYRMAAEQMGVKVEQVRLVAAHAWDVAGALRAGCAAAFVARPGMVLDPSVERPNIVGTDMREVVEQILVLDTK